MGASIWSGARSYFLEQFIRDSIIWTSPLEEVLTSRVWKQLERRVSEDFDFIVKSFYWREMLEIVFEDNGYNDDGMSDLQPMLFGRGSCYLRGADCPRLARHETIDDHIDEEEEEEDYDDEQRTWFG